MLIGLLIGNSLFNVILCMYCTSTAPYKRPILSGVPKGGGSTCFPLAWKVPRLLNIWRQRRTLHARVGMYSHQALDPTQYLFFPSYSHVPDAITFINGTTESKCFKRLNLGGCEEAGDPSDLRTCSRQWKDYLMNCAAYLVTTDEPRVLCHLFLDI